MSKGMHRRLSALLVLALAAAVSPPPVAAAEGWTVTVPSGSRLAAALISNASDNPARFALENKTRFTSSNRVAEKILELLNLGAYSQLATWQHGSGPTVACPGSGVNPICINTGTGGKALVPGSLRAILVASASASGTTSVSARPTRESLAFDVTMAAVELAMSVLAPSPGFISEDLVVGLAWQLNAEATGALDAILAGDKRAAFNELRALAKTATDEILNHSADWLIGLGVAAFTTSNPIILAAKLAVPTIKAVAALGHLFAARNVQPSGLDIVYTGGGLIASPVPTPSTATPTPSIPASPTSVPTPSPGHISAVVEGTRGQPLAVGMLLSGTDITVRASGSVCIDRLECGGPSGIRLVHADDTSPVMRDANVGALLGRVGGEGELWFVVGDEHQFHVDVGGYLYLVVNETSGGYSDNRGSFEVQIDGAVPIGPLPTSALASETPTSSSSVDGSYYVQDCWTCSITVYTFYSDGYVQVHFGTTEKLSTYTVVQAHGVTQVSVQYPGFNIQITMQLESSGCLNSSGYIYCP